MGVLRAVQASAMPSMASRELGHDLGFFGVAEVEAVGGGDGSGPGAGDFAGGFGDGVHRTKLGVEVAPASVAGESHGNAALGLACGRIRGRRVELALETPPFPAHR